MVSMVVLPILLPALIAAALSLIGTPLVLAISQRKGWFDLPGDPRKIHTGAIPRLGGIAMFWAFIVALLVSALLGAFRLEASVFVLLGGAIAIHAMGLADDFRNLRAYFKFAVQLAVAIAVAASGYRFDYLPGFGSGIPLGLFSWIITPASTSPFRIAFSISENKITFFWTASFIANENNKLAVV